jgi:glutamine synthetase
MNILLLFGLMLTSMTEPLVCLFTDLDGNLRGMTIPTQEIKNFLKKGASVDGSSLKGCTNINKSDLLIKPDLDSIREGKKQSYVFCNLNVNENEPFYACSRNFLKQALIDLKNETNCDLLVGAELEFYLVDENNNPVDQEGYFSVNTDSKIKNIAQALLNELYRYDIHAEKFHHEVSPGQYEISLKYNQALKIADDIVLARQIICNIAAKYKLKAIFSPKPFKQYNGSGMHIHYSLQKNKFNVFYDQANGFSDLAKKFIGGNLKYIQELALLTNFSTESYDRLVPGFEAPIIVCWGQKNRSAMIRQPLIQGTEEEIIAGTRVELRNPDCHNPYLAIAAIAISGLAGITENLRAPEQINENLYRISKEKIQELNLTFLPTSLDEALQKFKNCRLHSISLELKNNIIELKK